ncbi:uncharacterized protein LOC124452184 [Xenia sp. Carnegie-2017]|uniref:uncharacterized protein LOC124452184 n=1 Tax=Xenia sp. Carnegie-2017 TaxID=2897299 RepID=UPI001F04F4AB|nr:uncharacterized protein LOC124452184 [Xenia sp. Carnegie-2017]
MYQHITKKPSIDKWYVGVIERESMTWIGRSPRKDERERDSECGLSFCFVDDEIVTLPFLLQTESDLRSVLKFGDQVCLPFAVGKTNVHLTLAVYQTGRVFKF